MNRKIQYIIVLIGSSIIFSCQGSDLSKMKTVTQEAQPDEVSRDVKLTYSDSGRVKRILTAPLIHKYTTDTNYTIFPEGVHAQFFNSKGKVATELTCGYGMTRGNNDELIFRKNVVIKNQKNETLLSEEIYLKDSTIYSDSTVYVLTPSVTLRGTSLVAPRDFSSYKLNNPLGVARTEAFEKEVKQ
ncbi:LPS export ABC transporter periplasmic protein LptC [Flavobacteriales bacterium]|nr:LPS export ABC transporter periplasmic protein LptC [Flavobacteriales bacterium]